MKKFIIFLLSFSLGLIFLFGVFKYIVAWQDLQKEIVLFSPVGWVVTGFTFALFLLIDILRWREILRGMGSSCSIKELLGPYLAGFAVTYLAPLAFFGSDFLKVRAIQDKTGLSLSDRVASVFLDRIFHTVFNLILICIGTLLFLKKADGLFERFGQVYMLFFGFFIFCSLSTLAFLLYSSILDRSRFVNFFIKSLTGAENLSREVRKQILSFFSLKNGALIRKVALLSILQCVFAFLQCFYIIFFLGYAVDIDTTLAVVGPASAALTTPISADLGSHDIMTALVFERLGMRRSSGVAYASIFRVVNLPATAVGIIFLFQIGFDSFGERVIVKIKGFKGRIEQPEISQEETKKRC